MRKIILLCFGLICVLHSSYARENCSPITDCRVGERKNLTDKGEILNIGDGKCLICDADVGDEECGYKTTVIFPNGEVKQCQDDNGAVDVWHKYEPAVKCKEDQLKNFTQRAGKYAFSYSQDFGNGVYHVKDICVMADDTPATKKSQAQQDCEAAAARNEPANWNNSVCNCGDKMVWNQKLKKCEERSTSKAPDCKSTRKTQNGKACCDLPASAASYNSATDKCECKNSMEFKIVNGKGVCVMPVTVTKCPDEMINNMRGLVSDTSKSQEIRDLAAQVLTLCGAEVPEIKTIDHIMIIINEKIAVSEASVADGDKTVVPSRTDTTRSRDAIDMAINGINSVVGELDISVWKDAEGKFNTARLASDSVAAVVLGTTGGVVTSTVMKKHQVEDGFEDINCSIGGQVVAGWGDEFRVGIQ